MRTTSILIAIAASLVACSGEEDPTTNTESTDLCAAICDRDKECNGETTCGECEIEQRHLRPEARVAMTECFQSLTCSGNDDQCLAEGLQAAPPRDIDDNFAEACLEAVESCGVSDDFCTITPLFKAEFVELAIQCFNNCPDSFGVDGCLENSLGLN